MAQATNQAITKAITAANRGFSFSASPCSAAGRPVMGHNQSSGKPQPVFGNASIAKP